MFSFIITSIILGLLGFVGVLAQIITPDQLIYMLSTVIVYLATGTVNWIKSKISGWGFGGSILITIFVPGISALVGWIMTLVDPSLSWWALFGLGFVSTYLNELLKQWTQSTNGTQEKANPKLIG